MDLGGSLSSVVSQFAATRERVITPGNGRMGPCISSRSFAPPLRSARQCSFLLGHPRVAIMAVTTAGITMVAITTVVITAGIMGGTMEAGITAAGIMGGIMVAGTMAAGTMAAGIMGGIMVAGTMAAGTMAAGIMAAGIMAAGTAAGDVAAPADGFMVPMVGIGSGTAGKQSPTSS
jgi:hypothetical protein